MGDDVFQFEGWDAIEAMIREHAMATGYAVLVEKVPSADGVREEQIDNFDYNDDDVVRRAVSEIRDRDAGPSEPWSEPGDEPGSDLDEDAADELREDEETPPTTPREELIRDAIVVQCLAKLRRSAQDNITGERSKVYMVRIMTPKGNRALGRKQFTLRNLGPVREDDRQPPARTTESAPPHVPVYDAPIGMASLRAFEALAHHYERFVGMVHRNTERSLGLESETNKRLHEQLKDAYKQIDNLTANIITLRAMTSEEDKAALKQLSAQDRTKLANNAIDRFSDVAKAFFVARGMSEHAIKIANLLGNHPKIRLLLDRSDVVAVLSDPQELDAFAEGLFNIVDMSAKAYAERKKTDQGAAAAQ